MILFISTGDVCRSAMAAGYMRKLLEERKIKDVDVRSAGVLTVSSLLAANEAIQVMEGEDVDLRRHRSSPLTPELIRKADVILAMTPLHRQTAIGMSEEAKGKTYLLKEFARSDIKNAQIQDPMGWTLEIFKKCFKEIKAACNKLAEHEFVTGKATPARARKSSPRKKAAGRSGEAGKTASGAKKAAGKKAKPKRAAKKPASRKKTARKSSARKPTKAKTSAARSGAEGRVKKAGTAKSE